MSTNNQIIGPVASAVTAVANQEFTPEQLERIKSVVNCLITPSDPVPTPGAAVTEFLRTQDLMRARIGPIIPSYKPQRLRLVQLPAEIRNQIYRYRLVVGKIFPGSQKYEDNRTDERFNYQKPQNQLLQVCRQGFNKAAPLYFAKNTFVLPYDRGAGFWSWRTRRSSLVTRSGFTNLKSLSITFSMYSGMTELREAFKCGYDDDAFEDEIFDTWKDTVELLSYLNLTLLEVSLADCWCSFCHSRKASLALEVLLNYIQCNLRVVITGFKNVREFREVKKMIEAKRTQGGIHGQTWGAEFEQKDDEDKYKLAFQVCDEPVEE
ncbi:hypothetical protein AUEXF2481DRAFT_497273 [Aureobasidium subglaciale EXF-2481]|uniref:F-box domain-containing protein n=1 Tax=Aureobasidium subglaciale (strain EXF-2481) TaxID=1043005 RepID=A0A074YWU4_AURSE|nr:uncharacterized protein AUEXF2481DRAFT_497273 [Aureobasidium subglaciale EXF-2481]KAI5198864.1 hypothetical protein E4T38_07271 [Aureobasidium subglaciale]KAI5217624.1 hypothetical protein E4T40_07282 [Aureobasidium subglaciale]KAI5221191.1 hypothetical protein E4T41_07123 [Aureobasidium subglaciale]KAI5258923.1 hypothetical protein E4T46_07100 [Aureobasidium subglaciale]KEQ98617.1 hypothetical protein AUEXF2481DRAFT_497273 [Aureobasidium subglaciale EXF-2481]